MKRKARRALLWLAVAVVVLDRIAGDASACPNCKEAVSLQADEVSNMASGYNWSVLFMITVPFSLLGTGALMVHRAVRRGTFPEM